MIGFYYALPKQIVASKTHHRTSEKLVKCYFLWVLAPHWLAPYQEGEGAKEDKSTHEDNDDDGNEEVKRGEPAFLFYSTILWATRLGGSVAPRAGIVN
jgi:hypothetical protein